MTKDAQPTDQIVVKEPLSSVNRRWDNLLEGIGERQVRERGVQKFSGMYNVNFKIIQKYM